MTLDQIDLIGEIETNLQCARCLANEIDEDIFSDRNGKNGVDKLTWEYPRLQTFSFMILDYLRKVQESVDTLTGKAKE